MLGLKKTMNLSILLTLITISFKSIKHDENYSNIEINMY